MKLDSDQLLTFLSLSEEIRRHNHEALWEIQKHFTWWASILMGAVLLALSSDRLQNGMKGIVITVASIFGYAMARIGYAVVRREGEYFVEATQTCDRARAALGLEKPEGYVAERPEMALQPAYPLYAFDEVPNRANKPIGTLLHPRKTKLGVRDYFQLALLVSASLFVVALFMGFLLLGIWWSDAA